MSLWGQPPGSWVWPTPRAMLHHRPSCPEPPSPELCRELLSFWGPSRECGRYGWSSQPGHIFVYGNSLCQGSLRIRPGALPLLRREPDGIPDPQCGQPSRLGHRGEVVHGAAAGGAPGGVRPAGRSDDGTAAGCARPGAPLPPFLPSLLLSLLPVSFFPSHHFPL